MSGLNENHIRICESLIKDSKLEEPFPETSQIFQSKEQLQLPPVN